MPRMIAHYYARYNSSGFEVRAALEFLEDGKDIDNNLRGSRVTVGRTIDLEDCLLGNRTRIDTAVGITIVRRREAVKRETVAGNDAANRID